MVSHVQTSPLPLSHPTPHSPTSFTLLLSSISSPNLFLYIYLLYLVLHISLRVGRFFRRWSRWRVLSHPSPTSLTSPFPHFHSLLHILLPFSFYKILYVLDAYQRRWVKCFPLTPRRNYHKLLPVSFPLLLSFLFSLFLFTFFFSF